MDAVVVLLGFAFGEGAAFGEAGEAVADLELGAFEGLDGLVAGYDLVPCLGGELDDARAHRAGAEDADGGDRFGHPPLPARSWACSMRPRTLGPKAAKRSSLVWPLCHLR